MSLVLILGSAADRGAARVAAILRGREHEVLLLTPTQLERLGWEHRIEWGRPRTSLRLPDGRVLTDTDIGAVLDRLPGPSAGAFRRSDPKDRAYALAEWHALIMSWLHSLGERVLRGGAPHGTSDPTALADLLESRARDLARRRAS